MNDSISKSQTEAMILGLHANYMPPWDRQIANELAHQENINLTDAHFEVLDFLRYCYKKHGQIGRSRSLTEALEARFATTGGLRHLYQLFPNGPVTQGCKIAGVPVPKDSTNPSFGTCL